MRIAEVTTTKSSAANPKTDLRIVVGETTICAIRELFALALA
jgi:hypothetical protein